ncbi:MAG: preprotein translocase subunit SecE [Clostridia bacterium]|nr:preprotein translocase subunit SecE [Clostridia bacterium]
MANETKAKKNRIGMKQFFKEVSGEVKKLSWPTKKELVSYTLTVLGFIILMAVIIYVLDLVFGEGLGLLANL